VNLATSAKVADVSEESVALILTERRDNRMFQKVGNFEEYYPLGCDIE
jgi:hypothetical protein